MDNSTSEYSFISSFFASSPSPSSVDTSLALLTPNAVVPTPSAMATPDAAGFAPADDLRSPVTSEFGAIAHSISGPPPGIGSVIQQMSSKEEQALVDSIWKQVMDPVLEYCQVTNVSYSLPQSPNLRFVGVREVYPRPLAINNPTLDHDSSHGGSGHRDPETTLSASRELHFQCSFTNVAHLSKGYA
jgi:hypothetical protein